jgi:hypothetical protein
MAIEALDWGARWEKRSEGGMGERMKPVFEPTPHPAHTGEVAPGGSGLRFGFDFGFDSKSTIYFFSHYLRTKMGLFRQNG